MPCSKLNLVRIKLLLSIQKKCVHIRNCFSVSRYYYLMFIRRCPIYYYVLFLVTYKLLYAAVAIFWLKFVNNLPFICLKLLQINKKASIILDLSNFPDEIIALWLLARLSHLF